MIRFIDLFCGIGGFRFAAEQVFPKHDIEAKCVFFSDIDHYSRIAYKANVVAGTPGHIQNGCLRYS